MRVRLPVFSFVSLLTLASACGPGDEPAAETTPAPPIAGRYEVSGTTIETATGDRREISGTVILAENGDQYTATFHLSTEYPVGAAVLPAEVIGQGSGSIEGRTLRGIAETQLVVSTVPGIDPGFAFIPRQTSTRIVSNSVTSIANDGSVTIDIENQPAAGESYAPSRTSMRGMRVGSSQGAGGEEPAPSAGE
jgi:hypothetical protein